MPHIFGYTALVAKQKGSLLSLEIERQTKSGVAKAAVDKYECHTSDVAIVTGKEMKPKEIKSLNKLNGGEKRFIIRQAWGMQADADSSDNFLAAKQMLSDAHLRL